MKFTPLLKKSSDTPHLLSILKREWPEAFKWLSDVIDEWTPNKLPQIVAAYDKAELVGYYSLVAKELIVDEVEYTPWLGTLFVIKKFRGRGYSPLIIENACHRVKKMGYSELFLATDLKQYYEKYGFEKVGCGNYYWGEQATFYKKNLE